MSHDEIPRSYFDRSHLGRLDSSQISQICTRNRKITKKRVIQALNKERKEKTICWDVMPMEIDNHADTHVLGANFRPILFTRQECNVRPFLDEYQEVSNIPIVTGATAWDSGLGETLILVFGQRTLVWEQDKEVPD